jgi:hypothetical protein
MMMIIVWFMMVFWLMIMAVLLAPTFTGMSGNLLVFLNYYSANL